MGKVVVSLGMLNSGLLCVERPQEPPACFAGGRALNYGYEGGIVCFPFVVKGPNIFILGKNTSWGTKG